jgi:hypothetical protein
MAARFATLLLLAILAADLAVAVSHFNWMLVPALVAGWYVADLMSGVVHMMMDYRPSRPGIGLDRLFFYEGSRESAEYLTMRDATFAKLGPFERLVYDFKNHHPRPDALGRRSMTVQLGATVFFTTLPFAVIANLAFLLLPLPAWMLGGLVSFLLGATFAQYFHGTLHRPDNPWPVRAMRRTRLLMRPEDHRAHHETLAQDFSTINGWSNPVLNRGFRALRRRGFMPDEGLIPR